MPYAASNIRVSCLPNAEKFAAEHRAEITISLLDVRMRAPTFANASSLRQQYAFYFRDQESVEPEGLREAVSGLLCIAGQVLESRKQTRILVHCHGGASRSAAAAYILLAALRPDLSADRHFEDLLRITRKPWPNRLMAQIAEELLEKILDRKLGLLCPLDQYREKHPHRLAAYHKVNEKRGIVSAGYKR